MIYGVFEVLMLLCFAAAWPFSIVKQWRTRSSKGASKGRNEVAEPEPLCGGRVRIVRPGRLTG